MAALLEGKSVLITGGTGSFGKQFVRTLLQDGGPRRIIIFSRDELKQFEMANLPEFRNQDSLRFFIGDVRDKERLKRAFEGVDIVVHAAALKQVPACEYNPFEAIKTNVHGAQNVIDAAIDQSVERVVALSTDKACNPVNLYGATKLCSDKLFVAGNAYVGKRNTRFSVVRYGNVVGSRGSVIPFFIKKRKDGVLPITHPEMTRFWITLEQGVEFVLTALEDMHGGEIFIPKIPSMKITDLATAIAPNARQEVIGIRPGEKLHEVMISEDDARNTIEKDGYFVIQPEFTWWNAHRSQLESEGASLPDGFRYSSELNDHWLTESELEEMLAPFEQ